MQPWPADLLGLGSDEAKPDLRVLTRHQCAAGLSADLPAEQPGPEGRHGERVGHVEAHRLQSQSHLVTLGLARGLDDAHSEPPWCQDLLTEGGLLLRLGLGPVLRLVRRLAGAGRSVRSIAWLLVVVLGLVLAREWLVRRAG